MGEQSIVPDTSLLLYLGRIGKVDVLPLLYKEVCVPEKVVRELDVGRLLRADTIDPSTLDWVKVVLVSQEEIDALPSSQLGIGEQSVITYVKSHAGYVAGLDDRLARLFAEQLGIKAVGMIGVLLKAKRAGLISSLGPVLESARTQGFRMSKELYQEVLLLAGEKAKVGI